MRVLETQRILLKPVESEDLDYLLGLRWDKDIAEFLIHDPLSVKNQQDWFNNMKKNDMPLSIFEKGHNKLNIIGTIGLYNIDARHQKAVWRIRIDKSSQGKGYAKEAIGLLLDYGFNTLNLNKIISESMEDNIAIVNLTKKMGFKEEGIMKEHFFHQGVFKNAILFGLLRKDFQK